MVQGLIILWRLSVPVVQEALLQDVQVQEGDQCDWEQERHGSSKREGDEHHIEDVRILVVDEEPRPRVQVNVLLLGLELSPLSVAAGVFQPSNDLSKVI